jgi:hypothetical protein
VDASFAEGSIVMFDLTREIIGTQPILAVFLAIGRGYLVRRMVDASWREQQSAWRRRRHQGFGQSTTICSRNLLSLGRNTDSPGIGTTN